jgi:hypothetical protein
MKRWRNWLIGVAVVAALFLVANTAGSLALRSRHVQQALTARLEAAFGRPVQVGRYSFSLWGEPRIEADPVTVSENPLFGHEYFLRARSVTVTLPWTSLLRGRVEFGSFSLSGANLNVVDVGGRWNLEDWLPPVRPGGPGARSETPRLYRIDVHDGRINFEHGVNKLPFALVDVKGSVDESAPGRWRLSLAAQPMRAAVTLQSAGTLHLSGEVGGRSVRLRPASLDLRWDNASLSDVLRLAFGNDYGVRGRQNLELRAGSSGGQWHFEFTARESGMHRWDFAAEPGNPSVNVRVAGAWSPGEGKLTLAGSQISAPASLVKLSGGVSWPVSGTAAARRFPSGPRLHLHFSTKGIGARDLLAWYRSFHEDISPRLRATGWLQGSFDVDGWPPRIHSADLTGSGLRVAGGGLKAPVVLSAAHLRMTDRKASLLLAGLNFGPHTGHFRITGTARDLGGWKYNLAAAGSTPNLAALTASAQTLGARLSSYWKEFGGSAKIRVDLAGDLRLSRQTVHAALDLHDAIWHEPTLPARVRLARARVDASANRFRVDVLDGRALGAIWHGWIERRLPGGRWQFDLAANRLNLRALAARLQPRQQRPSLLERIFGFGHAAGSPPLWLATLDAEGRMQLGRLLVAPLALDGLSGQLRIQNGRVELSRAEGRFYGGRATGLLVFSVRRHMPVWRVGVRLDDVNLGLVSRAVQRKGERFSGRAYGTLDGSAQGTTAAALLNSLDGQARLAIYGARDRRINWLATLEAGHVVDGGSWFREVSALARLNSGKVTFENLTLSGARARLEATGELDLAHGSKLAVVARLLPAVGNAPKPPRTYHVTGSPSRPRVRLRPPTLEKTQP